MSGKLVGRVLDAAETGHLDHISRAAFHALIAIAERCLDSTHQGYAHTRRIQAAIRSGNSRRSALRAIRELKAAGLVRVVERGYRLPTGQSRSNLYELTLAPPTDASATQDGATANHVGATQDGATDLDASATQDGSNDADASAKIDDASAIYGHASAIQGGALNGIVDGRVDGGRRGCAVAALPPPPTLRPEPDRHCPKHPGGTTESCPPCGAARKDNERWVEERHDHQRRIGQTLRRTVDSCDQCDDEAWYLDGQGLPTNVKCAAVQGCR